MNTLDVKTSQGSDPSPESREKEETTRTQLTSPASEYQNYIRGWRLRVATLGLLLSIFLANFEISSVSTVLVSVTNDLKDFGQSSWIITSYLLTFTAFLIIWSKASDFFGRKSCLVAAVAIFVVFSAGCGASRSVTQLIVFRALQGIGGSGAYALVVVMFFEIGPETEFPFYTSLVSMVFAFALLIGPLIGGVITSNGTWRWLFYMNLPIGAVAIAIILVTIPNGFPHQGNAAYRWPKISWTAIDFTGAFLLMASCLLLITALQVAGPSHPWQSATILSCLIISAALCGLFLAWERQCTRKGGSQPVFPWRFFKNRIWMANLVTCFCVGIPFTVAVIEIPLRFQAVYESSPFLAGVRLLPFAFVSPTGAALAAIFISKTKAPPIYVVFVGAVLQTIGFSLLSVIPYTRDVWTPQYGFEVLAALGTGMNSSSLVLMVPFITERRDKAVAMGAVVQVRIMGGLIGLAIVTSVMNAWVQSQLSRELSSTQLSLLLESTNSIDEFPADVQDLVRAVFTQGYNREMRVVVGFSAFQLVSTAFMWRRNQVRVA